MKFKNFQKLYDGEVNKLVDVAGSAWAVYHIIKRCAFVDAQHRERSYWAYPSQLWISQILEWSPAGEHELTSGERKKIKRASDALEDAGLIRRYRPLAEISRDRARAIKKKQTAAAKEFHSEWQASSDVRDMLIDWGKMKSRNTRVIIYELVALREVETKQLLDKNVAGDETSMSTEGDINVSGVETELSPQEEQLHLEEKKKKSLFEERNNFKWEFIEDVTGRNFNHNDFLETFREMEMNWALQQFDFYWIDQIIDWLEDEAKGGSEKAKHVRWQLTMRLMGA